MKWFKGLITGVRAVVIVLWMAISGNDSNKINAVLKKLFEEKEDE